MSPNTFRMGDYRCLKAIRGLVQAVTGPETSSDELDCLNRLIEEARQFEMMDKQATLSLDLISSPKEDSKRYNLTPIPDLADLTGRIEKLEEEMRSLKLVLGQSTTGGENR